MPCNVHEWYFDSPCPKCAADPATAAVTDASDDPIPPFLRRNADGSFKFPQYPMDPEQSAERRKLEYALDEQKEQGDALSTDLDGAPVRNLLGLGD